MHFDRILDKQLFKVWYTVPAKFRAIHTFTGSGQSVVGLTMPVGSNNVVCRGLECLLYSLNPSDKGLETHGRQVLPPQTGSACWLGQRITRATGSLWNHRGVFRCVRRRTIQSRKGSFLDLARAGKE